ncbi:hypothetical protein Tco_0585773 [Tanacetum coccineum]
MKKVQLPEVKTKSTPWRLETSRSSSREDGDEDDEKAKDEMCLMAHAYSKVHSESPYFSDENSSIDDNTLDSEYNKL